MSATDRIDSTVKHLLMLRDEARERAAEHRQSAERFDEQADELNLEIGEWNAARGHMVSARMPEDRRLP